jgi:hypothetical protein
MVYPQDAEDQDIDRTKWGELESESEEESEEGMNCIPKYFIIYYFLNKRIIIHAFILVLLIECNCVRQLVFRHESLNLFC